MQRLERAAPLPREMQGRWVEMDDPAAELIVNGGEITCFGRAVDYDFKEVVEEHGALTVSLKIDDEAKEDAFQRANITGLVITPEGEFHVYNVSFGSQFVRAAS
jgi:uncharacterized glyoxalase superfamily protein PhnB